MAKSNYNLSELQKNIIFQNGTERAFDNEYWDNKQDGIFEYKYLHCQRKLKFTRKNEAASDTDAVIRIMDIDQGKGQKHLNDTAGSNNGTSRSL